MDRRSGGTRLGGSGSSIDGSRTAIVYYSRTGNTRLVASDIESQVDPDKVERIRPRRQRSYWNWLLRSFVPGSTVAIESLPTEFRDVDALFLGSPKWTFSCPPINEFIERANVSGVPIGLFITYGGFDERRYAEAVQKRIESYGGDVRATMLVKRDRIGSDTYYDRIASFCRSVLKG